jgi:hypothetical protein
MVTTSRKDFVARKPRALNSIVTLVWKDPTSGRNIPDVVPRVLE